MASSYLSSSHGLGALPNDFDLDSLPYIDGEVDLSYAQQLIAEEMRKFQPPKDNYLKKFPLPELRCLERLEMLRGQEAISKVGKPIEPKLNMERYQVQPPPQAMQNDVQAWKDAVSNAKSQMEHSANRLHNLEIMEKMNSGVWLHHNSTIHSLTKSIELNAEKVKRKIDDVNVSRRTLQEKEYTKIAKLHNKTYQAIATAWQIKNSL